MKFLDKFHIMYTAKNGEFRQLRRHYKSIDSAEKWLESIGAKHWEIGFLDLSDK